MEEENTQVFIQGLNAALKILYLEKKYKNDLDYAINALEEYIQEVEQEN